MKNTYFFTIILALFFGQLSYAQLPDIEWTARYNGTGNGDDFATAIATDPVGNVYVTGGSTGAGGSSYDYATIKYNNEGIQQWVARYNGLGNGEDIATDIVVDDNGIYVTGWSTGSNSLTEYATIKYDASGNQQWIARYSGVGNGWNEAFMIKTKGDNIYVTGASVGPSGLPEIATITYDASGNEIKVFRYSSHVGSTQEPRALEVDDIGNVYVSGWTGDGTDVTGDSFDFVTLKYKPDGSLQWAATYDGPAGGSDKVNALRVDPSGNVYITGLSKGENSLLDYATIKYNSDGEQQWVARYSGTGDGDNIATAMELFNSNESVEVVVTGKSKGTDNTWNFATVKYYSSGVQQWDTRYDGPGNEDKARALAIDETGNIFVTGLSRSDSDWTTNDYATIMYNAAGEEQWVMRYEGPGKLWDEPTAIVYTPGNIYVTGLSYGGMTKREEYATIRYATTEEQVTDVAEQADIPVSYSLLQNYPNPFNPSTIISFALPKQTQVTLNIYDIVGQHIRTLVAGEMYDAGTYELIWNGQDFSGGTLASGIYLYQIKAGDFTDIKKMILLK